VQLSSMYKISPGAIGMIAILAVILAVIGGVILSYNQSNSVATSSALTRIGGTPSSQVSDGYGQRIAALSGFAVESLLIETPGGSPVVSGPVYVASTPSQLEQGFQNIASFGDCNGFSENLSARCVGMIFVTASSQDLCFWMHDTPMPLQQVWISTNGTVLFTYQAQPLNDGSVCHSGQFVLETDPGEQIVAGDRVYQSRV